MKTSVKDLYTAYKNHSLAEKYQNVELSGWIRTNRPSKAFGFIEINDGTFFKSVQIVYEQDNIENFHQVSKLTAAAAITVKGETVLTPGSKQPFEIKAHRVVVEAASDSDYPLQKKRHSMEFLREISHLRPRTNLFSAVYRVRSLAAYAIHSFFHERNFVYVHTPVLTGSDAEGAGEMFHVTSLNLADIPFKTEKMESDENLSENSIGRADESPCTRDTRADRQVDYSRDFFGKPAALTVSGQLEAEAYALAFKNVYTFGPAFRAENSNTSRHASEFWMVEPEIAFADLDDDICLAEDMVKYVISYVLDNAPEEMEFFDSFVSKGILERLHDIVEADFARVTYSQAVEMLKKSGKSFEYPVEWGMDMQTEHERYLTDEIFKGPVFVTDYPKDIKAFYMRLNDDGKTVAAADLLAPGIGEIIGGSQREERLDVLRERMAELNMDETEYAWYLDLRKYGGVKHAGFGLGFERIVMYMTGVSNIRDVIPFPRTPKSLDF